METGKSISGKINKNEYLGFVKDIKKLIYRAQYDALKVVNKKLIKLYWDLGEMIVEKQEKFSWGKSIVESLAKDLQYEFQELVGFLRGIHVI